LGAIGEIQVVKTALAKGDVATLETAMRPAAVLAAE